jgi:hypothetical protein
MASRNGESVLKRIVTAADLAALVGMSERHIRRLTKSGVIALAKNKAGRVLRGRYVLGAAALKLFERERAGQATNDPNIARFKQARAGREECEAEMAKIELAAKRGEYLDRAMVEESGLRLVTVFRARCLAIPSAISHSLRGQTDFHTIYQIVETAIRRALHELADFGQLGIACGEAKNEEELEQCTARLRAEETRLLAFAKPVKAKAACHCACAD